MDRCVLQKILILSVSILLRSLPLSEFGVLRQMEEERLFPDGNKWCGGTSHLRRHGE